MLEYFRDTEYPALGYMFSVAAVNATNAGAGLAGAGISAAAAMMGNADAEFQSISGIKATRNTESYRPLGMNNYDFQLPTTTSYDELILERGVVKTFSDFTIWCNSFITLDLPEAASVLNNKAAAKTSYTSRSDAITKKLILVFLWDRNSYAPLMTWTFFDAVPKSIEYSSINAKESSYAVEKISIAYSHFTTIPNPVTPF
jgi:phage tail-like protein